MTSLISIIIPAVNEDDYLGATLNALAGTGGVETIVVDGGSRDSSGEVAAAAGVRIGSPADPSNQRVLTGSRCTANKKGPVRGPFLFGGERGIQTLDGAINPILP